MWGLDFFHGVGYYWYLAGDKGHAFGQYSKPAEADGVGLYSYLLLGKKPNKGSTLERLYLAALQSWLDASPLFFPPFLLPEASSSKLSTANVVYLPARNLVYVPVRNRNNDKPEARDLLAVYDWNRARDILAKLGLSNAEGSFLVTSRYPLSRPLPRAVPQIDKCMVINLAWTSMALLSDWSEDFYYESNHFDYTAPDLIRRLTAHLLKRWSAIDADTEPPALLQESLRARRRLVLSSIFMVDRRE